MRTLVKAIAIAALAVATVATPALAAPGAKPSSSTIVDIVLTPDGEFDVLQAAVIQAGLVDALSSTDRQFTVFAPTDDAFVTTFRSLLDDNTLTESDVISFISAGGVDSAFGDGALRNILLYHVTNGRRISKSVLAAPGYQMLNGERLTRDDLLQAGVGPVDISASNGVIHVIGSVLMP